MNDPKYADASVLIAGDNFGCGSSREHAPWSILDYGFRVIIAPSFADIFYNNSFKNGLVPIVVNEKQVSEWLSEAESGDLKLDVNLETKTIKDNKVTEISFDITEYHSQNVMNGWDDIALTLQLQDKISQNENSSL